MEDYETNINILLKFSFKLTGCAPVHEKFATDRKLSIKIIKEKNLRTNAKINKTEYRANEVHRKVTTK